MYIGWIGIAIAIIISMLVVNKLKISNIWMIPIVIAEVIGYGLLLFVFKMIVPILIISVALGIVYYFQSSRIIT